MSNERKRKTRNQRKHDMWRTSFMVVALVLLWMLLYTMLVKAWADEPLESGYEYIESIGGDPYEDFQD